MPSRTVRRASSTRGSWTTRRGASSSAASWCGQLEILADDVKCKHGSTTGQLDPLALFYLRSRGIGEEAARALLTYAFASDVVQRIGVEALRAGLTEHLQRRLPGPADMKEAAV
jgi:Fe-S cluster assembly protein SufD